MLESPVNLQFIQHVLKRFRPILVGIFLLWIWLAFKDSTIALPIERAFIVILFGYAIWSKYKNAKDYGWTFSVFTLLFIAYILYEGMILWIAPLPEYSLDKVLEHLAIFFLYSFILQQIARREQAKVWENGLLTIVLVIATLEFSLFFVWYYHWVEIGGSVFSPPPIGYRLAGVFLPGANFTSAFVNLILPIVLVKFLSPRMRRGRLVWGSALVLCGVAQYFSSSRAGWIAAITGIITALLVLYGPGMLHLWRKRGGRVLKFSATNLAVALTAMAVVVAAGALFARQVQNTPRHSGLLSGRDVIWKNSINLWSESLLLGIGPDTFPLLYPSQVEYDFPSGWIPDHAHNILLQVGVETGIVGISLVVGMTCVVGLNLRKGFQNLQGDKEKLAHLAGYAGVGAAMLVHHQADYMFNNPMYTIFVLLILAFSSKIAHPREITVKKSVAFPILLGLLFLYIGGSYYALRGFGRYQKGISAYHNDELWASQQLLCDASQDAEIFSIYKFQCALTSALLSQKSAETTGLAMAVSQQRAGLKEDTYWPLHWANLSILAWRNGNQAEAMASMQRAVDLAPKNALFAVNLGWMGEQRGDNARATDLYQQALQNDPWLQESPFFEKSYLRQYILKKITLDETLKPTDRFNLLAYQAIKARELHIAREHLDAALQTEPGNAEAYSLLGLWAQANDLPKDAWNFAQTAVFLKGDSPRILTWASRVALAQGRISEAAGYAEDAFYALNSKNEFNTKLYYYFTYQRFTIMETLAPGYIRADTLPEMIESFNWLVDYYLQNGKRSEAENVLEWLAISGLH